MADIFISYARKDQSRAKLLIRALEADGWTTWWDISIPAGQPFVDAIEQQLSTCGCVIVLWSRNSLNNRWVLAEAEAALARRALLPVLIDDVLPPWLFRHIQAASLVSWTGDRNAADYARLKADITVPPSGNVGRSSDLSPRPPKRILHGYRLRQALAAAGLSAAVAVGAWAVSTGLTAQPKKREATEPPQRISAVELPRRLQDSPFGSLTRQPYCCKTCTKGKACGDACIAEDRTCRVGAGCACDR